MHCRHRGFCEQDSHISPVCGFTGIKADVSIHSASSLFVKTLIKSLPMPLPGTYLHEMCKSEAHGKNINLQALFADGNILKKKVVSLIITKYGDTGTIN